MAELRGKGWRVLGYFVWMLGVGVVLDSDDGGFGGLLLAAGALAFLVGTAQASSARHEVET
jgi:hypothetical protein